MHAATLSFKDKDRHLSHVLRQLHDVERCHESCTGTGYPQKCRYYIHNKKENLRTYLQTCMLGRWVNMILLSMVVGHKK